MVLINCARITIFQEFFLVKKLNKSNTLMNLFTVKSLSTHVIHPPDESTYLKLIDKSLDIDYNQEISNLNTNQKQSNVFVLQLKMQFKSKSRQSTQAELQLSESISLVNTIRDWKVVGSFIKSAKFTYSNTIFGEDSEKKLSNMILASGANILFVVIDKLTISQIENLKKTLCSNHEIEIFDRYKIVLEIFKRNAKTKIAKLQIALAEIPYLRHKFDNKELYKSMETKLKKQIELLYKNKTTINSNRTSKKIPLVSIFGYTNVGKTSLVKYLTNNEKIIPQNKLFSTLDITYHGFRTGLDSGQDFIIIDTIGFINDIPHTLIEAFKISIFDAIKADLYIHLVDISHPNRVAQQTTVERILKRLAPDDKVNEMLTIYTKTDLIDRQTLKDLDDKKSLFISCKTGFGINELKKMIETLICKKLDFIEIIFKVPQGSDEFSYLYKNALVKEVEQFTKNSNFVLIKVIINKSNALRFIKLFPNVKVINNANC